MFVIRPRSIGLPQFCGPQLQGACLQGRIVRWETKHDLVIVGQALHTPRCGLSWGKCTGECGLGQRDIGELWFLPFWIQEGYLQSSLKVINSAHCRQREAGTETWTSLIAQRNWPWPSLLIFLGCRSQKGHESAWGIKPLPRVLATREQKGSRGAWIPPWSSQVPHDGESLSPSYRWNSERLSHVVVNFMCEPDCPR